MEAQRPDGVCFQRTESQPGVGAEGSRKRGSNEFWGIDKEGPESRGLTGHEKDLGCSLRTLGSHRRTSRGRQNQVCLDFGGGREWKRGDS